MPLYEFKCLKCDRKFEELVRTSNEKPKCPVCGSDDCKKLVSSFSSPDASGGSSCSSCSSSNCSACGR